MTEIKDKYGRGFKTLRVSLTDACNLACKYCVPDGMKAEKLEGKYSNPEILHRILKELKGKLPIKKIRFTGGEPLLHKNIEQILIQTKELGFEDIAITTNGLGVDKNIVKLKEAGLNSVNISLDASNASVFESITGFNRFERTIKAIEKCVSLGLKVKLNTVVLKNQNEDEIIPLLDFAIQEGIEIRFLELMKMGKVNSYFEQFFVSAESIKKRIQSKYILEESGRPESSTTRYYILENGYKFGIIENESTPFCQDCDRLRLGSDLKLYGCITATKGIEILDVLNQDLELNTRLQQAMNQKQDIFIGSTKSMIQIGG